MSSTSPRPRPSGPSSAFTWNCRSFSKLVAELDRRGIVTKRRNTKVAKYQGGIPFTYGPLAYFLKNRIYVGEIHHGGKWFKGEHEAILDRQTFDRVQAAAQSRTPSSRKAKLSESGALLQGKLFDDKGNRMGPSFSSKNGVRYRFYVSTALLRGRNTEAGSVARVSAVQIESLVVAALRGPDNEPGSIEMLERVIVARDHLRLTIAISSAASDERKTTAEKRIEWSSKDPATEVNGNGELSRVHDEGLIKSIVRAHAWMHGLRNRTYQSVERLAENNRLHPKVVRQNLRLAFLSPEVTSAILERRQPTSLSLARIPKLLPLPWAEHQDLLG